MEEMRNSGGKSGAVADEAEEENAQNSALFIELKHYCVQLLDLLQNPNKHHSFLSHLLHLLQRSSPLSLQPLFEYALAFHIRLLSNKVWGFLFARALTGGTSVLMRTIFHKLSCLNVSVVC